MSDTKEVMFVGMKQLMVVMCGDGLIVCGANVGINKYLKFQ